MGDEKHGNTYRVEGIRLLIAHGYTFGRLFNFENWESVASDRINVGAVNLRKKSIKRKKKQK